MKGLTWTSPARQSSAAPDMRLDIPVDPDADTAREWAEEELAKREYQQGGDDWLQRFFNWINDLINSLGAGTGQGLGGWGVVAIIVLALGLVAFIVWLVVGPLRRSRRVVGTDEDLGDPTQKASSLLASAKSAADAGDYSQAVILAYRSVIRGLDERGIIETRVGMTAFEAAVATGVAVPSLRDDITTDADVFDAVRYGHLEATRAHYEHILATRGRALKAKVEVTA